jgi:hypothetical protein
VPKWYNYALRLTRFGFAMMLAVPVCTDPFLFSTGNPERMARVSHPGPRFGSGINQETEAADDLILNASNLADWRHFQVPRELLPLRKSNSPSNFTTPFDLPSDHYITGVT